MGKIDLLTIGDASVDEFLKIHDAQVHCEVDEENCTISFKYGDKIPVEEFKRSVAGNAVNVAIGAKTMDLDCAVYCEIGKDANGDLVLNELKNRGVKTKYVSQNKNKETNVHPIIVFKGERTIFSYHEVQNYKLQNWDKPKFLYYTSLSEGFEDFQNELLDYLKKNEDIIFAMNPGSTQLKNIETVKKTFNRLDVLFVNKHEAQEITGLENGDIKELHKKLSEMGVNLSVITNGTEGSSTFDGEKLDKIGIFDIGERIDATGAGDSFAAGFLSAMHYGKSAKDAMRWGALNAANVITEIGAIEGLQSKEQMEDLIKSHVLKS